jgi:hypothetical protein
VLLFVEGARTESIYFTDWARRYRQSIQVRIDPYKAAPFELVKRASEHKRSEQRNEKRRRGRAPDQIWCVFDVDEHPKLPEARDMAAANGIHLAVSSPCIELWFMIHFIDQTAHLHRHDAQKAAENLLGCGKILSPTALRSLSDHLEDALVRSDKLDEKHLGDGTEGYPNPSSGVAGLVRALVDLCP